jgi:hypothetical protein
MTKCGTHGTHYLVRPMYARICRHTGDAFHAFPPTCSHDLRTTP